MMMMMINAMGGNGSTTVALRRLGPRLRASAAANDAIEGAFDARLWSRRWSSSSSSSSHHGYKYLGGSSSNNSSRLSILGRRPLTSTTLTPPITKTSSPSLLSSRTTTTTTTTTTSRVPALTSTNSPRAFSTSPSNMSRPNGLIATEGIELLTFQTPNGFKASILLEELKEAYNLPYTAQSIDISQNIQKEPWFVALNPNGRIPAVVDHDNGGLAVFEGSAILSYLSRRYDPDNRFSFDVQSDDYTRAETWIGWQHGGVGPMQGQANHFIAAAPIRVNWGIQRYVGETERLYGVAEAHLASGRDYLVGPGRGRYSIADIALVGWVNSSVAITIDLERQFPNLFAWFKRIWERPAVQRGFRVPKPPANGVLLDNGPEFAKKLEERKDFVAKAKEEFGYKYSSP
ncbi:hypothetical protein N3K66_008812 [Trichothecium roseum]|uniref:Uncharacterized protein n=1 Tax=Trichothecium roseum TaxID=47278 RepID=A0ACC0USD4_9HYPO|nr:hypothetical protein N3K66_008812 [Trichothecium roseum]